MKQKIPALVSLLLALCLLCGCSAFSADSLAGFFTGEDSPITAEPEKDPVQEDTPPEMAADAVLQDIEALEVLRLGYQEEYGLNPFTTESLCNRTIMSLLYEPLYLVNGQFDAEPVLAAKTEVSEDARTTTITLQRDVYFHTGELLTAQDVVASYELAKTAPYYGNRFIHIDSVTAGDDFTVVVTTDTAYEAVCLLLDFPVVQAETGIAEVPVGTGPFVYSKDYRLEKNPRWWREDFPIPCDAAELTPCTTSTDLRDRFEYGQINLVCTDPNSAAYASFHNDSERWGAPTTVMQYLGFNMTKKAFSSAAVRSCITYAIDRETIVAEDMGGSAEAASLPASPLASCYDHGLAAAYAYDTEKFQAALSKAQIQDYTADGILDVYYKGYTVPLEGTMIVAAGNAQRRQTAERIASDLNRVGFDITVEVLDADAFRSALRYGNYDLYFGEIRLSANFDLGPFFRSGGSVSYGGTESSAALDLCASLLENSGNAYDLHKRVMEHGYLCPVLFKSYTVYTTRGAAQDLSPALDWVIHGS